MENLKMLPRLTDNHVIPQKISKMKVKCAAQVFSQRVSSLMAFLASQKIIDVDARATANLCLFFDQLFDSVNGSYNKIVDGKKYRTAITMKSNHFELWEKSLPVLHTMVFIDSKSQKRQRPPTVKNWEKTIRGLKAIFTFLHSKGIKSVLPRNLNQDSLENFFGSLRSMGCRNNNPSCTSFKASYKTLLLNNLMSTHSPGSNCEDDLATSCLTSYQHLFDNSTSEQGEGNDSTSEVAKSVVSAETITDNLIKQPEDVQNLTVQTHTYISGYIIKKLNKTFFKNCNCLTQLCTAQLTSNHDIISNREYSNNIISLKYPNETFCSLVQNIIQIISIQLPILCHTSNLKSNLFSIVNQQLNSNILSCTVHEELFSKTFLNFIIKFLIHNWCNNINTILNGKISINVNEKDPIKINAYNRYVKFCKYKHLKNRKF
ncbi:uncharacterized protein LOC111029747 [Myzus persicae]|uniref:uncharacterized protein LOC111029747 n=1 Tax=Myzus persicae TaxID=13164 RepID=UPI000B937DF0|nr:uncharacterized protein LOC111029747 [Myzus persicae]